MTSRGHLYISQKNPRTMVPSARACGPLLLLPLLVAATCKIQKPLPAKAGAGALDPPSSYAALFYEMEECTGRRSNFRAIQWYVVPSLDGFTGFDCEVGGLCDGVYLPQDHAIYLADKRVGNDRIVKHEIGHALGLQHDDEELWRCLGQPMPSRYKRR